MTNEPWWVNQNGDRTTWWVDETAPRNAIGPICRFCHQLCDSRDDHDAKCVVVNPGYYERVEMNAMVAPEDCILQPDEEIAAGPPQLTCGDPGEVWYGDDLGLEIELENATVTSDVAAVLLRVSHNDTTWFVEGSSRRVPGDKPDYDLAYILAMSRALKSVQRQFERQAEGRIKNNDWIRKEHKKAAKKAARKAAK